MKDFQIHTEAMFQLLRKYATEHGLMSELSALLIVREVQTPDEKVRAAEAAKAGQPVLRMAIQGESPDVAISTIHYAAQILTAELREAAKKTLGSEPQA